MTFYICAVSFASSMLFDEKKNPYHLMLQKFMTSGAHAAVFEYVLVSQISIKNIFD